MKTFINSTFSKVAYIILPRALRKYIVKIMISAEESAPPMMQSAGCWVFLTRYHMRLIFKANAGGMESISNIS